MTSRNLARRLERLEEEILPGEERVIILHITRHTGSRGSPGTCWLARHVVGGNHSGGAAHSGGVVNTKTLSRRLKRLEAGGLRPEEDVVVIHIVGVSPQGERVRDGPEFRAANSPPPREAESPVTGYSQIRLAARCSGIETVCCGLKATQPPLRVRPAAKTSSAALCAGQWRRHDRQQPSAAFGTS
jgi:hypothetical protein